jgi:hypothetical protein
MKDTPWDHGLKVTGGGEGLVGHAGAVLLRELADRVGFTAALGSALARAGKFPLVELAMLLRPGNAGSNTFANHLTVLTAAIRQIPARMRSQLLVLVAVVQAGCSACTTATTSRTPSQARCATGC